MSLLAILAAVAAALSATGLALWRAFAATRAQGRAEGEQARAARESALAQAARERQAQIHRKTEARATAIAAQAPPAAPTEADEAALLDSERKREGGE